MCYVLLSGELKFFQDRYGFFQTPLSRYAIDLSHSAIRYAIAAAKTVSGRYAALSFLNAAFSAAHQGIVQFVSKSRRDTPEAA